MRKTTQIITLFVLVSTASFGQFDKGTVTFGGEADFEFYKANPDDPTNLTKITSFSISPEMGYFFIPNLLTGVAVDYGHSKWKPGSQNTFGGVSTTNRLGAAVLARYYYKYFFGETRFDFGKSKVEIEDSGQSFDSEYRTIQFGIGRSFMVSKEVAIEPKLSYTASRFGNDADRKSNQLNLSVGIRVYVGRGNE